MSLKSLRWAAATLASLICVLALSASTSHAAPSDPFTGAAPTFDAPPAQMSEQHNMGDWGVSDQRGAATYTFPIPVPPGRKGMQPTLALRYSSRSSLRGGLAAGWSFELPSISLDRSLGVDAPKMYQAALGNASGRLAQVPDPSPFPDSTAYRVHYDDTFTRFFQRPDVGPLSNWVALTPDGVRHQFGTATFSGDGLTRWLISRQEDPHGNTIRYFWSRVTSGNNVDFVPQRIEYTSNSGAGLGAHAKVEFGVAPLDVCTGSNMPIGSAPSASGPYLAPSTGNPAYNIDGSSRLISISTYVRDTPGAPWRITRLISLTYDWSLDNR